MTAGRAGWLPAALVALLALPFHPFWLDFEQVRRGLLLGLLGAMLIVCPRLPRTAAGVRPLLLLLLWGVGGTVLAGGVLAPALERGLWLLALLLLLVMGQGAAALRGVDWGRATAPALLAWSAYGLLQAAGVVLVPGYDSALAPVSTFGNLNVASEATAVAAALVLGAWTARTVPFGLGPWATVAAAAYLGVNGSRSGLVALPLAALWLLGTAPRSRRGPLLLVIALAALGGTGGVLLPRPAPPPADPAAAGTPPAEPSTLAVRWEIARGAAGLFAERPVLGHGLGQFQIEYPRHRTQQEIELSSFDRQFRTEVRTAHDDYLEVLVEHGVPGFLLLLWFLLARSRGGLASPHGLAPWLAFAALMLVRSPLGNAPAVALAILGTAVPSTPPPPGAGTRAPLRRLVGVVLVTLGLLPLLGNTLFAAYQQARTAGGRAEPAPLHRALAVQPWESRYLQLLAQELAPGDPTRALAAVGAALALRPHDVALHLLHGELLLTAGRFAEAREAARSALRLDPGDSEAQVLLSGVAFAEGDHEAAIAQVWDHPHRRLQRQLPQHFGDLRRRLEARGQLRAAVRYAAEEAFAEAFLALDDTTPAGLAAGSGLVQPMMQLFERAQLLERDPRPWWLAALHMHRLGDAAWGATAAAQVRRHGLALPEWQRWLLGAERLATLRGIEGWHDL